MNFTWDPRKNAANIAKHGISFERAIGIFSGPTVEKVDDRYEYEEIRVKAIGLVETTEVFVVYAEGAPGERRIISARKANRKERTWFWRQIGTPDG